MVSNSTGVLHELIFSGYKRDTVVDVQSFRFDQVSMGVRDFLQAARHPPGVDVVLILGEPW